LDAAAEAVREVVEPMIDSYGMELVQIHYVHGAHRATVRLFVDKKAGAVGIDDLEKLSRLLGDALDVEDAHKKLFKAQWDLEVSSPGIDRPLTKKSHYGRALDQEVRVKTRGPVEGSRSFAGRLEAVDDDVVRVRREDGSTARIPWDEIVSAHTVFVFESAKRPAPKRKKKSHRKTDEE
jgi:ribosome maturation factor RimP